MSLIARIFRNFNGKRLRTAPIPKSTPEILDTDDPIEEQKLPSYTSQHYYPVRIGEIFDKRYQTIAKLGFGATSTVWLAKDTRRSWWQSDSFVALKLLASSTEKHKSLSSELEMSRSIVETDPKSKALQYLRTVSDSFQVKGPDATHLGLIYEPMRESMLNFQRRLKKDCVTSDMAKPLMTFLLTGLDHLHTKCHIIHTDLKSDNILLAVESQSIFVDMVNAEAQEPTPYKLDGGTAIYYSRNFGVFKNPPGRPRIADFGLAVRGDVPQPHNHDIQANLLQAPEVILRAGWSYSADIWNLGVLLWDFLENKTLFDATDEKGSYSPSSHLFEMISLLGPPPNALLERGERTNQYFTARGFLQNEKYNLEYTTLEDSLTNLHGEDKVKFLKFVRRMLRWLPEDRATARELLEDPWLKR